MAEIKEYYKYDGTNAKYESVEKLLDTVGIFNCRIVKETYEGSTKKDESFVTWAQLYKTGWYDKLGVEDHMDVQMLHANGYLAWAETKLSSYLANYGVSKDFAKFVAECHPDNMQGVLLLTKALTRSGMVPNYKSKRFILDEILHEARFGATTNC